MKLAPFSPALSAFFHAGSPPPAESGNRFSPHRRRMSGDEATHFGSRSMAEADARSGADHAMPQLERVSWRQVLKARAILGWRCGNRGALGWGQFGEAEAGRLKHSVLGRRVEGARLAAESRGGTGTVVSPNLEAVARGGVGGVAVIGLYLEAGERGGVGGVSFIGLYLESGKRGGVGGVAVIGRCLQAEARGGVGGVAVINLYLEAWERGGVGGVTGCCNWTRKACTVNHSATPTPYASASKDGDDRGLGGGARSWNHAPGCSRLGRPARPAWRAA